MSRDPIRKSIFLTGVVQGVGFRPTVYRLAVMHELAGWVRNRSDGLEIEIEGLRSQVEGFLNELKSNGPPYANVTSFQVLDTSVRGGTGFQILRSQISTGNITFCPSDLATCGDCSRELFDSQDRRYRYPFVNCTNCGPRFTLIKTLPYDREQTSMACFRMCERCESEYNNPLDRRYHAQPNACPVCGPRVWLADADGAIMESDDPLGTVADEIRRGKIIAIKGIGGFHLAADATNHAAVTRLRRLKRRLHKPFAVMAADLAWIHECAEITPAAKDLLTSAACPIVLLPWKRSGPLTEAVAPGLAVVGLMLPYTPVHHLLFMKAGETDSLPPLVMTSGNVADEPLVTGNRESLTKLSGFADIFLLNNRDIISRADDSVVQSAGDRMTFVRRSRGFVPGPVFLPKTFGPTLGTGAFLKATPCLINQRQAFLSQHVGDLSTMDSAEFHAQAISALVELSGIRPKVVGCDLNPDFPTSIWAREHSGLPVEEVQHHHAHVIAAALEQGLTPPVLGLVIDGTGFGTDGAIWGCELLLAGEGDFVRLGHMKYVPLPGGDAAVRDPWRSALGFLLAAFDLEARGLAEQVLREISYEAKSRVIEAAELGINTPSHSSCGRLFDAVSALAGFCVRSSHEAQAPMALESAVGRRRYEPNRAEPDFSMETEEKDGFLILDPLSLIRDVVDRTKDGEDPAQLAKVFHDSLIRGLVHFIELAANKVNTDKVVITGGCLLNQYLSSGLEAEMRLRKTMEPFFPRTISPGDGAVSLGQAAVAAWRNAG